MSSGKPADRTAPATRVPEKSQSSLARRKFLANMAGAAGGGCLMAMGVGFYAHQARALPALALRPPGALPEDQFLAACTRCGLCVRECPSPLMQQMIGGGEAASPLSKVIEPGGTSPLSKRVETGGDKPILKLAVPGDPVPTGTPYFTARSAPCLMCEDIPCVKVCPSGALNPQLTDIADARMGLAALVDHETCLNYLGLRCDVCYRVCPVIDKAITLESQHNPRSDRHAMLLPTVHPEHCTGCGLCEKACVLSEAAIRVLPPALAQGKLGEHYRKGWEEREKHGDSLIGDQVEYPVRGMENRPYGDTRVGDGAPTPPAEEPLPAPDEPDGAPGLNSHWKP
jgi:ferredoxin-type protein NapG